HVANGYKNLLAIAAVTERDRKEVATIKEFIRDPSKFVAVAVASAPAARAGAAAEKKEEAKKVESESEEDDDMGFGPFD
ncbi:60S acidic ribosomal protein P0-like, partial [Bactrocera tryoni]|uniref:60S acidic ribosomal protein P0-like n=1 Tax=Bactrocera tryoni TaxID=59916 RepID=UPI001A978D64